MRWLVALLLAAVCASAGASASPGAAAASDASMVPADASLGSSGGYGYGCLASAGAPPCGYITPLIDMEFAAKPKCAVSGGTIDLAKCAPLPAAGESVSFEGQVRWYWKLSEDLTYPPQEDIVVSLGGTALNPSYLPFKVEPAQVTITAAELFSPNHMPTDQSGSQPVVYYSYDFPIKITVTHAGAPTPDEVDRLASRHGLQSLFLKAKSTSSGAYFKEAFGVEEFRFDASGLTPDTLAGQNTKTASGAVVAPFALMATAWALRRRSNGSS